MIKQILLTLLLTTTLCFAKLGDSRETLETVFGHSAKEWSFSAHTNTSQYFDPDGETIAVIVYYDNKSVVETYFSKHNRRFGQEFIQEVISTYGQDWLPLFIDDDRCRCVKTADTGFYRICYGPIAGTPIDWGLTVLSMDAKPALLDMGEPSPYKKSNGLRL